MDKSHTYKGMTFKNRIAAVDGHFLLIEAANIRYPRPITFRVNATDSELIHGHRWCVFDNRVYTRINDQLTPIEAVLLRRPTTEVFKHRDGNTLDVTRANLELPRIEVSQPNVITAKGNEGLIQLSSGLIARIDRDRINTVSGYRWLSYETVRPDGIVEVNVKTVIRNGDKKQNLTLAKCVLGLQINSKVKILYNDGDKLNCTVNNLTAVNNGYGHKSNSQCRPAK